MLSQNKMVRKHIESLFTGRCSVYEYQKFIKANKSTGYKEVLVLEDIPCRLSYKTITSTDSTENANKLIQVTKLFMPVGLKISPGSKIIVTQNNVSTTYKNTGVPAVFSNHQEVVVELFKEWS